jgi:hypothetical protein
LFEIMKTATFTVCAFDEAFAIARLPADCDVPTWAGAGPLVSVTRTPQELSIVCLEQDVPPDVCAERGWRCFAVAGPLAFSMVGVLQSLINPLVEGGIAVFVVSTFETDYLLVKAGELERAVERLEGAGHNVIRHGSGDGAIRRGGAP